LLVELGHGVEPSVGHFGGWDKDFLVGLWVNDLNDIPDHLIDLWSHLSGFSGNISSGVEKLLPVHEVLLLLVPLDTEVSDSWVSEVESSKVLELVPVESEVSDSWMSEVESSKVLELVLEPEANVSDGWVAEVDSESEVLELLLVPVGTNGTPWSIDTTTFVTNVDSTHAWNVS